MIATLNNYITGYATIPVIIACIKGGLFENLAGDTSRSVPEIAKRLRANKGYLKVALDTLEALQWVSKDSKGKYSLTPEATVWHKVPEDILELVAFPMSEYIGAHPHSLSLEKWIALSGVRWEIEDRKIAGFLDGMVAIPLLLALRRNGQLDINGNCNVLSNINAIARNEITEFFINQGLLFEKEGNTLFTDKGLFIMEKISVATVVDSYKSVLAQLFEIIFGDYQTVFKQGLVAQNFYTDRYYNDLYSADEEYSEEMDEIIVSIFNQQPYEEQPKYIAEMGCGAGKRLKSIFETIKNKTLRGKVLDAYPLTLIGMDSSGENLAEAESNLQGLDHSIIVSDLSQPEAVLSNLRQAGVSDTENVLYIRSFLEHCRQFYPPTDYYRKEVWRNVPPIKSYVDKAGNEIAETEVMQSLVEHFQRLADTIGKHGVIVLERHEMEDPMVRKLFNVYEGLYFDAYQRFAGNFTVTAEKFLMAAAHAGLFPRQGSLKKYPKQKSFCRVTLTYFERRNYSVQFAKETDLPVLEELEKKCWETDLQRPVSTLKKRIKQYPEGQLVLKKADKVVGVIYSIRLEDPQNLHKVSMETVESLHQPEGAYIQFVAINVLPEMQHENLGDQLLEFMLQRGSLINGIEKIVAVTKCKDYGKHQNVAPEEYIRLRNEQGRLADTILRFHELHGAIIKELVADYRPPDITNKGYGVLVEYAVHNRQRKSLELHSECKAAAVTADQIREFIVGELCAILGDREEAEISTDQPLMELGLDSADLLELNEQISFKYKTCLPPTFFFQYNTAERIVAYLEEQLVEGQEHCIVKNAEPPSPQGEAVELQVNNLLNKQKYDSDTLKKGIAIIGIACRLPGGIDSKQRLWELLFNGEAAIRKMSQPRWLWPKDIEPDKEHKSIDYGGFLEDIACFDAAFFRISPKEAELMDPQQRIMLELSWQCLEDGGYSAQNVAGSKTGVFIGASGSDYNRLLDAHSDTVEAHYGVGTSMAVLPNRISYYYDLHGPSMQIDTACSSSLVAMHEAVRALQAGECCQALVGGINIICHPANSIAYYKAGMLSGDGKCNTFDKSANGYVRGEGAVMLLLKPLEQAMAAQDTIYAVIRGTAINHGGQAGGLTVPNPARQADLLVQAYQTADIAPETVSYIEAHGTGTSLGDPIEVSGIKEAFARLSPENRDIKQPYCGLGSIKTNLGHLEAAAGLAGVLKVIVSMQHKVLPASLNFTELNPHITLDKTPFYIVKESQPWQLTADQAVRRAGVSSFGSGGANAHVVLEEAVMLARITKKNKSDYLICLSAKTDIALRHKEAELALWLEQEGEKHQLSDIAATLLLGREHFNVRAAYIVGSTKELQGKLAEVSHNGQAEGYFRDSGKSKEKLQPVFLELMKNLVKELAADDNWSQLEYSNKLTAVAELYVKGYNPDWAALFAENTGYRVNLPGYPFARERYWFSDSSAKAGQDSAVLFNHLPICNPLLQQNTSDFFEHRFSSTFTGREFYLSDHIVKGQKILPAVAYLEMARAAVESGTALEEHSAGIRFRNVAWFQPIVVEEQPVRVHIRLRAADSGEIDYEIVSSATESSEFMLHSQGKAELFQVGEPPVLNISAIQAQCSQVSLSATQCYDKFRMIGLDYGPGHQGIAQIFAGHGQVLAKLCLPVSVDNTKNQFMLHPSLLDAALQGALLLNSGECKLVLPFALQEAEIYRECTAQMWALVRYSEGSKAGDKVEKLDIRLCDEQGNTSVLLKGISLREMEKVPQASGKQAHGVLLLEPYWRETIIEAAANEAQYEQQVVVLGEGCHNSADIIKQQMHGVRCITLEQQGGHIGERYQQYIASVLAEVQSLLKSKAKGKVLLQVLVAAQGEQQLLTGLSGLLKTAELENPKFTGQLLAVADELNPAEAIDILNSNSYAGIGSYRYYRAGKWYVPAWREIAPANDPALPWQDQGIYLITGGAGGLGMIFAQEIVQKVKAATLIIAGRSDLTAEKQKKLDELSAQGSSVVYQKVDVTQKQAVADLMRWIQEQFGKLNGIIHGAGLIRDNFIIKKTQEEVIAVLAPKVSGLINLDEATKKMPLDFFMLFSSTTGVSGNLGQADYAAANAFMDQYARYRQGLVQEQLRSGRTLAINWPLWQDGGMQVDAKTKKLVWEDAGLSAMKTETGIQALYRGWSSGNSQVMVLEGDIVRLYKTFLGDTVPDELTPLVTVNAGKAATSACIGQDMLRDKAENYFKRLLSGIIKLPVNRIEADTSFETYGIDSIMVMQMTKQLEKVFGSLSKTLFFEYQNIQELKGYFLANHQEQLALELGISAVTAQVNDSTDYMAAASPAKQQLDIRFRRPFSGQQVNMNEQNTGAYDIAIIGLAGRYPQAKNIQEFWENLRDGRDCVSEIPKDRWDYSLYFAEDKNAPGKSYSKWGGFLDGVDQFDPLFFNIAPREAEIMDPQERLFLQCVYEAIEDAGYTRDSLSKQRSSLGNSVGVYVGVMWGEYQLYGVQEQLQGKPVSVWGNPSSIANRVSYVCNFNGPSMAVDTMCSSSLSAIHLACQSLQQGECEVAIAGGVNVSIHPNKYLFLSQGKFVSSKGRCESFGQGGDGYVPGEGVGAVLLKALSKAIADGDQIYGVIKATAVNHGGKNNGYTVPNPNAQASVIGQALKKAGIDPGTISYIEAHGTGTSLGDPIEIAGLVKVFQKYTEERQFCAIGSAKSNIGHAESAAGISGLTKVLLQLKHRQLVPSLHSKTLNINIDFASTPFVVQQELAEWKRPIRSVEGGCKEYPRIAGISSFGAGGANAHVLVEEFIPQSIMPPQIAITTLNPAVFILSAKSKKQLTIQAKQLLDAVQKQKFTDSDLAEIAYTLQVGREAMEERLAFLAGSIQEFEAKLKAHIEGQEEIEDFYLGQVKRNKDTLVVFMADEDLQQAMDTWIYKRKYSKLLALWVKGLSIDWNKFYGTVKPRRISLPTYPFNRERYWIPQVKTSSPVTTPGFDSVLHPLLHKNTSDLSEQRFSTTFTGQEFFLADHIVKGQRILPGVAYLEMARAAVEQAAGYQTDGLSGVRLRNVSWTRPMMVKEEPVQVHIGIFPDDTGELSYEIYNDAPEAGEIVYSQGSVLLAEADTVADLDLASLQKKCIRGLLSSQQCYEALRSVGLAYGPAHQGIERIHLGEDQLLAKLVIPASIAETKAGFGLHPSLLDSALQASLLLNDSSVKLALPFALEELGIFGKCASAMWALVRYSEGSKAGDKLLKFDIHLADEHGRICLVMKGFSARVLEGALPVPGLETGMGTLLLQPAWREQPVAPDHGVPVYAQHVVVLCEPDDISSQDIENRGEGLRCLALQAGQDSIEERFCRYATQIFEELKSILARKPQDKVLIQVFIPVQGEGQVFSGLAGLLKTAQLENPKITGQLIEIEAGETADGIIKKAKENRRNSGDYHIQYQAGTRLVYGWNEVEPAEKLHIPWKDEGVYLITGGTGGLGLIFAKEVVSKTKQATLVLTGRTTLTESKRKQLEELAVLGAHVEYEQVDVTQKQAVCDFIQGIQDKFGKLDGIIHGAGIIRDNFILRKSKEELQAVLEPKVAGLVYLDQASRDLQLDFFILFSSVAGALGNVGQADYATGNAFMDAYARYRNMLVAVKQRYGQTLTMNWPLWKEGGMHVDAETEKLLLQTMGMTAMQTSTGIHALYQSLGAGGEQVMVIEGDIKRIRAAVLEQRTGTEPENKLSSTVASKPELAVGSDLLKEKAENYFRNQLAAVFKLSADRIEVDAPLEKYGIDSIMIMQITNQLERTFGSLSKTLFFEYQTIQELTEYFLAMYQEKLKGLLDIAETVNGGTAREAVAATGFTKPVSSRRARFTALAKDRAKAPAEVLDIAIIGVSGRYPQAQNLQQFWENLRAGKDCITEIPAERWDHSLYFDADKNIPGKTYSKWGGFLADVDKFDPLFFNISPREAEIMDPQERLFLQCVHEAIEDAGYTRDSLGRQNGSGIGGNVGVYVGVMYEEYQLYGAQEQAQGRSAAYWGSASSVANRVSYFYNFHGPSMAVDTMCSSSLTAIHLACQSLQRGGCELAIAGGVNVSIHPNKYLLLGQSKFVSSKGRCESFGQGGDGYVPGEGVGAILLKPLERAIADGDQIYGVIQATAINHGGKTNGYTVPNPGAQAGVIASAFREAGINPRMISYIEAHGTGTSLGDPIEIAGLTKTFREYTPDKQFCAIGSAKSNIGHCESAAGIAGVTKVLLQFKYGQLVPSLHSQSLNPNIDFADTPFVVQQELAEWKRPLVEINGQSQQCPRIAGISSFGAGGANAHIIIKEYMPEKRHSAMAISAQNPIMVILSAKNEEQLKELGQRLVAFLAGQQLSDEQLIDVAYTLQVGREAMEERVALLAASQKELEEKLSGFIGGHSVDMLYRGQVKPNKDTLAFFAADEDMQKTVEAWINKGKYNKLLELWVKGFVVDWHKLYSSQSARRVSLPTYPFARERYWGPAAGAMADIEQRMHPLLHKNTSDILGLKFTSEFSGGEFFFADHVINGQRILPGAAYLEMIRAAVEQGASPLCNAQDKIQLRNIVWVQPIIGQNQSAIRLHIGLNAEENGAIAYEIYSEPAAGEALVHAQGSAALLSMEEFPSINIGRLKAACDQRVITADTFYEAFKAVGFEYGARLQGIETLYIGQQQVLAKLKLPVTAAATQNQFVLHPSILDAVFQATFGFVLGTGGNSPVKPGLPFALEEVNILGACTSSMWAFLRYSGDGTANEKIQKVDIDLYDEQGNLRVMLKGFSTRLPEGEKGSGEKAKTKLLLAPVWVEQAVSSDTVACDCARHVVAMCEFAVTGEELKAYLPGTQFVALHCEHTSIEQRFNTYAAQLLQEIQNILRDKTAGKVLIQLVIPAQGEKRLFAGLFGLLKTAQLENPKIIGQLLELSSANSDELASLLEENARSPISNHIRYQEGKRYISGWNEVEFLQEPVELPWQDKGVYLITGGAGGLGLLIAREIALKTKAAKLILIGRAVLTQDKEAKLKELEGLGAAVEYRQVDVADKLAVTALIQSIVKRYSGLQGIIHSSGVLRDSFLINKTSQEMREVLKPKVNGLVNLDEASKELQLDFFVLFSSVAGSLGNAGQADYAMANAFMDAYGEYRNTMLADQKRTGRTLSVNWPLWKEGGMRISAENEEMLWQTMGMCALSTATGLATLYQGLAAPIDRLMVLEGNIDKLSGYIGNVSPAIRTVTTAGSAIYPNFFEEIVKGNLSKEQFIKLVVTEGVGD